MPIILTGTPATTTARAVINDALTFGLNRLSPGETLDADLAAVCLSALNSIVDEINGGESLLFRHVFTQSSAITGTYGTLGVHWSSLAGGEKILGATVLYGTAEDVPLEPLTMAQYESIANKTDTGTPGWYAHDGMSTVFLYPQASGAVVTLRTLQQVSEFDDLDTEHAMPAGYRSALAALLAEKMGPIIGGLTPFVAAQAKAARDRLHGQVINPAIVGTGDPVGARIERGF